ncbi:trimethylguanosine synthase [Chironomus tepperi]|uniref:trimethylguanosine synthase n=1 Tax=Chironomus tepperi TaxID=113505 RepID=UPI00391FBD6E
MSVDREILAEIHLNYPDSPEHKINCLCTRIFLKNSFPIYASTLGTEETSEADDVFNEKADLSFFRDTNKLKSSHEIENDNDANSCYYSASHTEHTDNYYSTDEHETIFQHTKLHSSDSGADLSEKNVIEKHMEIVSDEIDVTVGNGPENDEEVMNEDPPVEYHHERNNSLPELFGDEAHQNDWEKYWAKNGERLIWQTWIEKYIDYINPEYLDKNNMQFYENTTSADTNKLNDTGSSEQVFTFDAKDIGKFNHDDDDNNVVPDSSMEIVISPPAKQTTEDLIVQGWNQLSPDSITKQEDYHNYSHSRHYQHHHHRHNNHQHNVSFHEIDNLLSPRCESINSSIPLTLGTFTDSMTNVTRMTCSSYGFGSSHVTSESTPTSSEEEEESNTISSFSDSEESDNQMTTRVANECERLLMEHKTEHEHIPPAAEDKDSEEYWQMKWQQHVQEMYVRHYNEFMEAHRIISDEMSSSFKSDSGFLPGENAGCCGKFSNKRRRKKHSLQRLVANLNLRSDLAKYSQKPPEKEAPTDGDEQHSCHHDPSHSDSTVIDTTEASLMESLGLPTSFGKPGKSLKIGGNGDDEEPPEERPVNLKRSHELDADENYSDHIKSQFELMGYIFSDKPNDNHIINGEVVYRKKHVRLHTRMLKMFPNNNAIKPKHTYFDDDGNEINDSNQSGADTLHASSSDEEMPIPATRLSSSIVPQFTTQLSSDGNANEDDENAQNKEEIVNINLSIDQDYDSNCIDEAATLNETQSLSKKEKKKKRKGKFQMSIPLEIANDKVLKKYWYKRFSLFNLFDFGIRLDRESWFSVTPEKVAAFTAERCKSDIIIDAFCGVGGNCIQFAKTCEKVIAIDIDPKKIEMARHNANIYGVQDKIEFIVGNYFNLVDKLKADVVFLSPPWGGPSYMKHDTIYDLEESLLPVPASQLMSETRKITSNIAVYLPRNSNTKQLAILAGKGNAVEIEQNFLDRKLVAITAYYGNLVQNNIMTSQK